MRPHVRDRRESLVSLHAAGRDVSGDVYRRGVAFLLRTQFADGSWLVRSRSFPVQPRKESGFPHAKRHGAMLARAWPGGH